MDQYCENFWANLSNPEFFFWKMKIEKLKNCTKLNLATTFWKMCLSTVSSLAAKRDRRRIELAAKRGGPYFCIVYIILSSKQNYETTTCCYSEARFHYCFTFSCYGIIHLREFKSLQLPAFSLLTWNLT